MSGSRARLAVALGATLLACAACSGGELDDAARTDAPVSTVDRRTRGFLLTTLGFTRQKAPGVREGFDLDDRRSVGEDEASCFKRDAVDPSGREGIDNELSGLVPTIDELFAGAVDGLFQSSIRDGQIVMSGELRAVDDVVDDAAVEFVFQAGKKNHPSLGTDGVIEGFQTIDADPAAPRSATANARIVGGVLHVGPLELAMPIAIFGVQFVLHIQQARLRATIDEEGNMEGLIGGGVVIDELIDGVAVDGSLAPYLPMLRLAMSASADMGPDADGVCRQLSAAFTFKAKPAFVRWP